MQIIVLKSNLSSHEMVDRYAPLFELNENVFEWSVDTEDKDKVLRLACKQGVSENDIISMFKPFQIELSDFE